MAALNLDNIQFVGNAADQKIADHNRDQTAHGIFHIAESGSPTTNAEILRNALANRVGTIYISADCLTSDPLVVRSGTRLVGLAEAKIRAGNAYGDRPLLTNEEHNPTTPANRDHDITIENIEFDGNRENNTSAIESSPCIFLRAAVRVQIINCTLANPKGDGLLIGADQNTQTINSEEVIVSGCTVSNCARNGIAVTEGTMITIVDSAISGAALHAVDLECNSAASLIENIVVRDVRISGCGSGILSAGVAADNSAAGTVSNVTVQRVTITDQIGLGFYTRGVAGLTVSGVNVSGVSQNGFKQESHAAAARLVIENSVFSDCGAIAVQTNSTEQTILRGVTVDGCSASGYVLQGASTGDIITGCVARGCNGIGILIQAKKAATISACVSASNAGRGFYLDSLNTCTITSNVSAENGSVGYEQVSMTACVFEHNIDYGNA